MGVIYLRTNKINGKKYVGQATTKRFKARQRKWNDLNQSYAGPAINAARAKYGIDAFDFEILKECDDKELDYWEKHYIKELCTKVPNGYNLTEGGGGMSGYTLSEETKRKISEAQKGRKLPPRSEEQKKKISEANKGKTPWNKGKTNIYSEETKRKMSEKAKGRKLSEETKKKMSEKMKGENNSFYGKHHSEETKKKMSEIRSKTVLQIDKSTYETIAEFPSASEAERQLGFMHNNISACCKGKQKTCGGYIWKYKEESAA